MKKLLVFGLIGVFAVALATAAYLVSSFVITVDVYEPFSVEYAILGDGGNWDGVTTCDTYTGAWQTGTDMDVGGLYAGEGRMICTKITNAGEGAINYTFYGEVVSGLGNYAECVSAFGNPSVNGVINGSSEVKDGVVVMVSEDAIPVEDC